MMIYLVCGPAGCGKSTWIKGRCRTMKDAIVISRDVIRFSMVKETEDYFSKETEVFNEFIKQINAAIAAKYAHIFIDATHLTPKARAKVLNRIHANKADAVWAVQINCSEENNLKRNQKRLGRERVPDSVVLNMRKSFIPPSTNEPYIDDVITINWG